MVAAACTEPQHRSSGYVTAAGGARLYWEAVGRGVDTVLTIHGGPGETSASLLPGLDGLARRRMLIGYDQRGNGRSSIVDDSTALTIEHHLDDLDRVRKHFGIRRVTLLGHSWGGALAALYAARHPHRVERLVLVDPAPARADPFDAQSRANRSAGFDSTTRATIGQLVGAIFADTSADPVGLCVAFYRLYLRNYFLDAAGRNRYVDGVCRYPGYRLTNAARVSTLTERSGFAGRRWDSLVTRVTAPVLVVHGASDFLPRASAELWAAAFPAARLVVIERSGHSPFIDRPDAFVREVERFLRADPGRL